MAKECLPQAEKEFSSYAAKIREGKDRESTELHPFFWLLVSTKRDKID